ncbi:hypothetical protein ABVK25_003518 [Lepraria finkii]|uniref:Uncharacterized protein n=1 Tax=Lepraria finkii TaxID=1340010 RepID=A0ABR4BI76_9LECA
MLMEVINEPSSLGPGTASGRNCTDGDKFAPKDTPKHPTIQALPSLLVGKGLKYLILPADMFDITPDVIQCISTELKSLESLTRGFDYSDPWMLTVFKHDFLPNMANTRRMTFLSLNRPINADGTNLSEFDALGFHRWLDFLSEYVPSTCAMCAIDVDE